MMRVVLVVREVGRLNPEYSLDFELPEVPAVGTYISIHRPDKPHPYGEDMIVEKVWWQLKHPETRAFAFGDEPKKIGSLNEIVIECVQATGPYSSDRWRDMLEAHRERGAEIPAFEIARVQVRQDAMEKK
jgi:hypothetical protein